MPYSGPNDPALPANIKSRSEADRSQWVALFNRRFGECIDKGGDNCEAAAFRLANGTVLSNEMLTAAASVAQTRREQIGGKPWLIAPVILIHEGVLNGTAGAELVLADEFGVSFQTWNGRPFMVGHPKGADDSSISANDPAVMARQSIGSVYKVHLGDANLKGEIWIDMTRVPLVDGGQRVVDRLEGGQQLPVSTGYFRDRDETPGEHAGRPYAAIARNLRPDHLAALLDSEGACSWADGCGAPRINQGGDPLKRKKDKDDQPNAIVLAIRVLGEKLDGLITHFKKEVAMTHKETLKEDGRLNLNEEQLEALSDDAAETLVAALADLKPCPEKDPVDNEEGDPNDGDDPDADKDTDGTDAIAELTKTVTALSDTIGQFKTAFASIQANEEAEKAQIVTEIVAMESAFTEDQLKVMEIQTLDTLRRSLRPADYSGQGGGPAPVVQGEALDMPDLWAEEK